VTDEPERGRPLSDDTPVEQEPTGEQPGDATASDAAPADAKPKHAFGERIREHLRAAEVAAEESAGYGWVTESVEAVESAVNPEHELGTDGHGSRHNRRTDGETGEEPSEH
jgi:hypothetical protein